MAYTSIDQPEDYFNTVLYTANNGTLNVTGVGFQPDWVWIKGRSYSAYSNIYDVIRGVQKDLLVGSTNAEGSSGELTSFNSDGFTVVDGANDRANYLTNTHVAWNWLAGGTASSNTDGSITSTVSANTTSGFSVVKWTGDGTNATIGHGLSSAPKLIITKRLDTGDNWYTYHSSLGNTKYILLEASDAEATSIGAWNNTSPTSSVFTKGSPSNINGGTYVAYCFAEKKGFSKFGSYTGNGSANGPMIYTGFKPAWVLCKKSSAAGDSWTILDNKRDSFNVSKARLFPDQNIAESTSTDVGDFLSNGFKIRTTAGTWNDSGGTYIYMAFAESPFTTSTGIPTTAR